MRVYYFVSNNHRYLYLIIYDYFNIEEKKELKINYVMPKYIL